MNLLSPISEIMSTDLISVSPYDDLEQVKTIFDNNRIHHIPVVKDGAIIGLVSKSDYLFFRRGFLDDSSLKRLELIRLSTHTVSEIMTTGLATLAPDQKINVAIELLKENLFHAVPVVEDEQLVGIVTTWDIINQISEKKSVTNHYE